jgi:hypothetical protein
MCRTDSAAEITFEVFEECPTIALSDYLPDQLFKLRYHALRHRVAARIPLKTATLRKLK